MSEKILVVDDEIEILDMLKKAFEPTGYTVICAESGEEALDILKQEQFLVMFLDLQLPGIKGLDLCRKIREDDPIAFLFAISGYASVFNIVECREAGFDDYFLKPFNIMEVVKVAEDAFAKLDRWRKGSIYMDKKK